MAREMLGGADEVRREAHADLRAGCAGPHAQSANHGQRVSRPSACVPNFEFTFWLCLALCTLLAEASWTGSVSKMALTATSWVYASCFGGVPGFCTRTIFRSKRHLWKSACRREMQNSNQQQLSYQTPPRHVTQDYSSVASLVH